MDLAAKLQLKVGQQLECRGTPAALTATFSELDAIGSDPLASALLVFVENRAALDERRAEIVVSASKDRLTWVAYPKSGQLSTDLNRDSLAASLIESGAQPVRQIAIDDVWSALRFRPG